MLESEVLRNSSFVYQQIFEDNLKRQMEIIENIRNTIGKRLKGDFGGTFILIWTILNWKLIYILFNFDNDCTLFDKLKIIEEYIKHRYPWRLFLTPLLLTIGSVFSYSVLNYITYSITTFFSLRVRPYILKIIDTNTIVERGRYTILEKQFFELDSKYTNEKANFLRNLEEVKQLKIESDKLKLDVQLKQLEINNLSKKSNEDTENIKTELNKQLQDLKDKLKEKESENYKLKIENVFETSEIMPSALFIGNWEKTFFTPDNRSGKEQFSILGDKYIINGNVCFEILYVKLYADKKFIELKKVSTFNKGELLNRLVKISDTYFIGTENDNTKVEYKKIIPK